MDMPESQSPRGPNAGQVVVGLIIVTMGLVLLVDRYFAPDLPLMRSWWPLVLIVMGAARLATDGARADGGRRSRRSGAWLLMVGLWAVVSDWHLFGFTFATSWPLLVIGAGVMMVWRSVELRSRPAHREP